MILYIYSLLIIHFIHLITNNNYKQMDHFQIIHKVNGKKNYIKHILYYFLTFISKINKLNLIIINSHLYTN